MAKGKKTIIKPNIHKRSDYKLVSKSVNFELLCSPIHYHLEKFVKCIYNRSLHKPTRICHNILTSINKQFRRAFLCKFCANEKGAATFHVVTPWFTGGE